MIDVMEKNKARKLKRILGLRVKLQFQIRWLENASLQNRKV